MLPSKVSNGMGILEYSFSGYKEYVTSSAAWVLPVWCGFAVPAYPADMIFTWPKLENVN